MSNVCKDLPAPHFGLSHQPNFCERYLNRILFGVGESCTLER